MIFFYFYLVFRRSSSFNVRILTVLQSMWVQGQAIHRVGGSRFGNGGKERVQDIWFLMFVFEIITFTLLLDISRYIGIVFFG